MKFIYIFFFLLLLTSCFGNDKQEEIIIKEPKKIEKIPEISKMEPMIKQDSGSIFTGTENTSTNSGKTEPKELEFTITPVPNENATHVPTDDASITKYVNDTIHFTKINYVPDDLDAITGKYILDTKGNQTLRKEPNLYLQELAKDFYEEFGVPLKIVSAYRSYNYQVGIKQRGCSDLFCAKAGYSEHQSGLAFDMFEATSQEEFLSKKDLKQYFEWMKENAHKYGFHNSYQKGKQIDGYAIEPWHWRYLGVDFATELKDKNMTYAEYYQLYGQK